MTFYNKEIIRIGRQYLPGQRVVDHLANAKAFIDLNYCSAIDLPTIAAASFLSKFHFIRLFKKCYGRTPHQYLTEKRIQRAKELLCLNNTVAEVCYHIGFESPNTFAATFKKYVGVSPAQYRKKQFSIPVYQRAAPVLPLLKQFYYENKTHQPVG